jgi:hypothetical protein
MPLLRKTCQGELGSTPKPLEITAATTPQDLEYALEGSSLGVAGAMPMAPGAWPQMAAPCCMKELTPALQAELCGCKIFPGRVTMPWRRGGRGSRKAI